MSYERRLFLGVAFVVGLIVGIPIAFERCRTLTISDLQAVERDVVTSIEKLDVNVAAGDAFGCDFRPRGRLVIRRGKDSVCHIQEFELLPTVCAPVGVKHIIDERTTGKIILALAQLPNLERSVVPDATDIQVEEFRALRPNCTMLTQLSDARPYSAKVALISNPPNANSDNPNE